jgi:hypothetical protein
VLRRFQGRRGWPELKRKTRRTHWWGCGHETGVREGRTTEERLRAGRGNSGEEFRPRGGAIDRDRARLEPIEVGKYYGSTPGHGTRLGWPDTARGVVSKRGRTSARPNWPR